MSVSPIPISDQLFDAAASYQRCEKYAADEAEFDEKKAAFKDAVNGLLNDPATSRQNVKRLYAQLRKANCKRAQKKIIDYFTEFQRNTTGLSGGITVEKAYDLGVDFDHARENLRTEEYVKDRTLRKEFKAAIPAEMESFGYLIEQIVDILKINKFSEFICKQAIACAKKPCAEENPELEKQDKFAFFVFISV
jgi:hypothetical protein